MKAIFLITLFSQLFSAPPYNEKDTYLERYIAKLGLEIKDDTCFYTYYDFSLSQDKYIEASSGYIHPKSINDFKRGLSKVFISSNENDEISFWKPKAGSLDYGVSISFDGLRYLDLNIFRSKGIVTDWCTNPDNY